MTDFIPAVPVIVADLKAAAHAIAEVFQSSPTPVEGPIAPVEGAPVIVGKPSTAPPPHVIKAEPAKAAPPKQYAWRANKIAGKRY